MKKVIGLLVGAVLASSTIGYAAEDASTANMDMNQPAASNQVAANDSAPAAAKPEKKQAKHHHAKKKHHKHHGKKVTSSSAKKPSKTTQLNTTGIDAQPTPAS